MVTQWISLLCDSYPVVDNEGSLDCDRCPPGRYRIADCTRNTSTLCGPCLYGTYNSGCSKAPECTECSQYCDDKFNLEVKSPCTPMSDLQCDCKDGFWRNDDQLPCIRHKFCGVGQGAKKGNFTHNTICTPCINLTYSNIERNYDQACKNWTHCEKSKLLQAGNSTHDNVCSITTDTPSNGNGSTVIIALSVVGVIVFIVAVWLIIRYLLARKKKSKEPRKRPGSGSSVKGLVENKAEVSVEMTNGSANGPLIPAAESTGCETTVNKVPPDRPNLDATKFKKLVSDTKCASYITTLGKASRSVALLKSDRTMGTCFRVGSRYLLTCWHVVKEIIGERLQNILCDRQCVRVTFDYDNEVENKLDVYYLDGMVWKSEELDACILALEPTTTFDGYETHNRDPLVNFGDVPKINRERFVTIVGHPDGKSKEVDPSCEIISHTLAKGRIENAPPELYKGFDNKTRLLYNACLEYGASGAPVFMQNHEKKAVCVAMHEKGYPLNADLRRNEEMVSFEQGILMSDIAKAVRKYNIALAEEIFGKSLLQLTLSGGPHV